MTKQVKFGDVKLGEDFVYKGGTFVKAVQAATAAPGLPGHGVAILKSSTNKIWTLFGSEYYFQNHELVEIKGPAGVPVATAETFYTLKNFSDLKIGDQFITRMGGAAFRKHDTNHATDPLNRISYFSAAHGVLAVCKQPTKNVLPLNVDEAIIIQRAIFMAKQQNQQWERHNYRDAGNPEFTKQIDAMHERFFDFIQANYTHSTR